MEKPLTYFLEKLNNIQCFQLYINTPEALKLLSPIPEPKIQVVGTNIHVFWDGHAVHIPLDGEVTPNKSSYEINEDCLLVKFEFHMEKRYVDKSLLSILKPQDLENLCCRSCGTTILREDGSGNKQHMKKFLQFPREEIRARETVCFVGDTYFLLHASDLRDDAVELSGLSARDAYGKVSGCKVDSEWMPISCAGCHEGLGLIENIQENKDNKGGEEEKDKTPEDEIRGDKKKKKKEGKLFNYKLFKHRLSTAISANEEFNVLKIFSAETLCAANILSTSQMHTTFKYHICNLEGRVYIQISLLNWDTTMLTNLILGNDLKVAGMTPILKILYRVCDPMTDEAKKSVDLWNNKFSPRTLTFFDTECKELVENLKKSTQLLPPSKRDFRGSSVGFLQFISED